MSRTIGSYVLASLQSQTCSSHYTESCITTRSPWLGMMCSPRVGEVRVQPKPAQPSTDKNSCCQMEREYLDSKELETGMQYAGRNPAV